MYFSSFNKHDCCGCGACFNICPKKSIKMKEDEDGFLFPQIDKASCIFCHLCEKVCPENTFPEMNKTILSPVMAAVKSKDDDLILKSASGGAFTQIVRWFLSQGDGYIYGAAWDDDLNVKHICSWNDERTDEIRGSKYVQSDLGFCFNEIKQHLLDGHRVLFSGTPCQVAALRNIVGINDNLVCVDLVCHGAPSQKIFNDYVSYEEKRMHKKITKFGFRHKIFKRKWLTRNIIITTEDGEKKPITWFKTDYLRAYHPCLMNRESCYECRYSKPERYGDITIGDFWGVKKIYPQLIVEHGVNVIQFNTKIGVLISSYLKNNMDYYPVDRDVYMQLYENSLARSGGVKMNPKRKRFLEIEREQGFHKAVVFAFPFHIDFIRYLFREFKKKLKVF